MTWQEMAVKFCFEEKFSLCFHSAVLFGNSIITYGGSTAQGEYVHVYKLDIGKEVRLLSYRFQILWS